jgi:4-hydroxybenzoate polyprenyltransferase
VEHDKQEGLYSWPSRYGIASALFMAKVSHVITILILIFLGLTFPLKWPFWIGVVIAAGLLAYENSLVKPNDLSKMNQAFFQMNSYVAVTLFVGTFLALIV